MASLTIISTAICSGGEHVTIQTAIVGGPTFSATYQVDELRAALTLEEAKAASLTLARWHCTGMTKAQAKTALTTPGILVVTS